MKKHWRALALLAPAVILYLMFQALPLALMAGLAFSRTNYITWQWVGLKNIVELMASGEWWGTVLNGLIYCAMIVPATISLATFVGLMMAEEHRGAQHAVRFTFYVPTFAAGVIIVQLWKWMLNPRFGLLNWLLGTKDFVWLGNKWTAMASIAAMLITTTMGGHLILIMATILAIPKELYEQATVDGASWPKIKRRIILPLIMPAILLVTLIAMIGAMQMWETIYLLTSGGPAGATTSPVLHIWQTAFTLGKYGEAAAQSVVLLAIILALALVKRRVETALE